MAPSITCDGGQGSSSPYEKIDLEAPGAAAPTTTTKPPPPLTSASGLPPPAMSKIAFLDGLRGLAAMAVVFHHAGYFRDLNLGAPAVDLFFVLSSFLLTLIFEKKARELFQREASYRSWALSLADYFVRRFLRVYPLFVVVACALALLDGDAQATIFGAREYYNHYNLWKTLVFSVDYRYHVFWTLPIEIGYYFIIPPLVIAVVKASRFWWVLATAGYAWVFYSGLYINRSTHREMGPHIPTFLCGSLAAVVYGRLNNVMTKSEFELCAWHVYAIRFVELFFLAIMLSDCFHGLVFNWVVENPFPQPEGGVPFVSFSVTVVIVGEMLAPGPISSVLEWSLLRYAGKVSYSMYLLHNWIVLSAFIKRQGYYDKYVAIWTLVFLVSTVSFHLIEAPSQKLAAYVGKGIKKRDIPTAKAYTTVSNPSKTQQEASATTLESPATGA